MAHFSTIHIVAFLQAAPTLAENFFQSQLIAGGKTASKALGCARAGDLRFQLDQTDAAIGFAVLVPTAADALRLASPGVLPRTTLRQWSEELHALFEVVASHRARVCLLSLSSATNSPSAAMAAITTQFDLGLPTLAAQEPVTLDLPGSPIGRLAAHVLAADDAAVRRLEARLQAKSITLPSVSLGMDNLLGDVLHQIAQLDEGLEAARAEVADRDRLIEEKSGEIIDRDQRLVEQTQQLVERGEGLVAARAEVVSLAQHIELIRTSTSWRLTGPLRRFRRLFTRR